MTQQGLDLRPLIAEAVRDIVKELVADSVAAQLAGPPAATPRPAAEAEIEDTGGTAGSEYVTARALRTRTEKVRITDDADLDAFVRQLLTLFENPKNRQDLRAGRLRFHLATHHGGGSPAGPALLVESGAVTERRVIAAHDAGKQIVLGPHALLTPLGRERARELGVSVERKR